MVFQRRHRSTLTGTLAMAVVLAASVVAVTVAVLGDPDADPSTTSPSAPAQAIPVGTSFTSTSVTGVPIPGSGPLTIAFPEPGRISATAGCNRHMGSAVLQSSATGNILVIGTLASTMMACLPPHDGADAWGCAGSPNAR
ncbi:META domain-containing protein [Gordonia sp. DT30]|uniref:META domain-containing protein n=1 Tax=Gordonia sp. DT30 TaxID=3416546 RepID=UPI003CECF2E4